MVFNFSGNFDEQLREAFEEKVFVIKVGMHIHNRKVTIL